jgi:hypothetical protein
MASTSSSGSSEPIRNRRPSFVTISTARSPETLHRMYLPGNQRILHPAYQGFRTDCTSTISEIGNLLRRMPGPNRQCKSPSSISMVSEWNNANAIASTIKMTTSTKCNNPVIIIETRTASKPSPVPAMMMVPNCVCQYPMINVPCVDLPCYCLKMIILIIQRRVACSVVSPCGSTPCFYTPSVLRLAIGRGFPYRSIDSRCTVAQQSKNDQEKKENRESGKTDTKPPDWVVFTFGVCHDKFIPFSNISMSLIPRNGAMIPPTP